MIPLDEERGGEAALASDVSAAGPTPASPSPMWTVGAAVAAEVAAVLAPASLASGPLPAGWWLAAAVAPLMLVAGLIRGGTLELVVGAPLGWMLPGYFFESTAAPEDLALAALVAVGCYLAAALWWLRPLPRRRMVLEWTALDGESLESARDPRAEVRRDPIPWLAVFLVAAPAVGIMVWPAIGRQVSVSYPDAPGAARVGLALLGTLFGLALAADLSRARPARRPSRVRRRLYAFGGPALLMLAIRVGGWL